MIAREKILSSEFLSPPYIKFQNFTKALFLGLILDR